MTMAGCTMPLSQSQALIYMLIAKQQMEECSNNPIKKPNYDHCHCLNLPSVFLSSPLLLSCVSRSRFCSLICFLNSWFSFCSQKMIVSYLYLSRAEVASWSLQMARLRVSSRLARSQARMVCSREEADEGDGERSGSGSFGVSVIMLRRRELRSILVGVLCLLKVGGYYDYSVIITSFMESCRLAPRDPPLEPICSSLLTLSISLLISAFLPMPSTIRTEVLMPSTSCCIASVSSIYLLVMISFSFLSISISSSLILTSFCRYLMSLSKATTEILLLPKSLGEISTGSLGRSRPEILDSRVYSRLPLLVVSSASVSLRRAVLARTLFRVEFRTRLLSVYNLSESFFDILRTKEMNCAASFCWWLCLTVSGYRFQKEKFLGSRPVLLPCGMENTESAFWGLKGH